MRAAIPLALAFACLPIAARAAGETQALTADKVNGATLQAEAGTSERPRKAAEKDEPDPLLIKAQVLLDRVHASPGTIDGRSGDNYVHALDAFATARHLPSSTSLTPDIWAAIGADQAAPVLTTYVVTAADIAGPFTPDIPADYGKAAKLKHLDYRNPGEMLGERFHMDVRLLKALNPDVGQIAAGTKLVVTDVTRAPVSGKLDHIDVDKAKGEVRGLAADGTILVAYPATIGSTDLPSPSGTHDVKGVAWHPVYSYDPKKNFQQGRNTRKLTIPAGPNNPVGTVFIALDKPTYGLHGTPDPTTIDKTHSHGCVRMTNWDAEELAHLVRNKMAVHFIGS